MVDFGLKRNGSGYYDGTFYNAVMNAPKPGEVWSTTADKLFLVLKNHGKYCTTLSLNETNRDNECLGVIVEHTLYTNPAMLGYTFNSNFCECVKKIPDEQLLNIMDEVGARLGVEIVTVKSEVNDPKYSEEWLEQIRRIEADRERLSAEIDKLKDAERAAMAEVMVWKERAANASVPAPDPETAVYKRMYYELLDRIISRGAAV